MMKFTNFCFIILSLIFLSCSQKTLNINSSIKKINYPGVASASPFVGYEINFESKDGFTIEKIQLNNQQEIIDFSLYQFSSRNSITSSGLLEKGKYILSFNLRGIKQIEIDDLVMIQVKIDNKIETYSSKVLKKEPFRAR